MNISFMFPETTHMLQRPDEILMVGSGPAFEVDLSLGEAASVLMGGWAWIRVSGPRQEAGHSAHAGSP